MKPEETIAAIATPPGEGGVGMIRVSGPDARQTISGNLDRDPDQLEPRHATLSGFKLHDEDQILDHGIVIYFPEPRSYTGEDVVEITCHGSPLLLQNLLEDVISHEGVRLADPGEFTRRAFENDKLDLAQADAVASLISARSDAAMRSSARQLQGELSEKVDELRENLIYCRSRIEACLDFSDQDSVGAIPEEELLDRLADVEESLEQFLEEGKQGQLLTQGCNTVITGRPNVGKSSLMNRLLRNDRAIVTAQPGTTRDVVSDQIELDGIPFELHDTAGIRSEPDEIEAEGVERSKSQLQESDLILFLVDQSEPLQENDREVFSLLRDRPHLVVANKNDLPQTLSDSDIEDELGSSPDCRISAKTGEGLDRLREMMVQTVSNGTVSVQNPLVTQTRHLEAFRSTLSALRRARDGLEEGRDPTLIAQDLQEAADAAGEVTGEITTDDVLDRIFSSFCIGK